jgi:hypothetical protein
MSALATSQASMAIATTIASDSSLPMSARPISVVIQEKPLSPQASSTAEHATTRIAMSATIRRIGR